jgi:hypothetical protein
MLHLLRALFPRANFLLALSFQSAQRSLLVRFERRAPSLVANGKHDSGGDAEEPTESDDNCPEVIHPGFLSGR